MSIIGDLIFLLRGDPKQLNVDVKKAGDTAGQTFGQRMAAGFRKSWSGQNIGKGLVQGLGLAGGLGAVGLFTTAISKMGDVLGDATQAALAEEVSIQKLSSALKANIPNWNGQTAAIEDVLKARMALGFSDDEQRESLALLVVATNDVNKALDIQRTAMDLARLKGISLAEASSALIKIEGGQFRALKALGIQLPKNATQTQALAAVQKAANRQAADYAKTNAGKLLVSQVKVGEALEQLGTVTMPIVVKVTEAAAEVASDFADALANIGTNAANNEDPLQNMANILHDMFKEPEEDATTFIGSLFDGLNDLKGGLDDFARNLNDAWTFWDPHSSAADNAGFKQTAADMKENTDRIVGDLNRIGSDVPPIFVKVADASGDMAGEIKEDTRTVIQKWEDLRAALKADADSLISEAFDPLITKNQLAASNAEASAARRIIASKKASNAEKGDARDVLDSVVRDQASALTKLADAGMTGSKAYKAGMASLEAYAKTTSGKTRKAIDLVIAKIKEAARVGRRVPVNFVVTGMGGMSGSGEGLAEGGTAQARVPVLVGERGPEIFVPEVRGTVMTNAQSVAAMASGGGTTTNIQVALPTSARPDPFEVATQLRRLADFGVLSPPPRFGR